MVIIREDKKESPTLKSLREFVSLTLKIDVQLSQYCLSLGLLQLSEHSSIYEGTPQDRRDADQAIRNLIPLLKQLKETRLNLNPDELSASHKELQSMLNMTMQNMENIRKNILTVWSMRGKGTSKKDNDTINSISSNLVQNINQPLKQIQLYVAEYNKKHSTKLNFKVKWEKLPK